MVEEARVAAQSKAGEVAVLRQKYEISAREYEQKITTLRQLHQEAYNKQRAELDAVRKERKRIAEENMFLEHERVREAGRMRQVQRSLKDVTNSKGKEASDGQAVTPKKSKVLPFRDGFDDGDMIISPTKSKERSRPGTPKAGAKRKRPGTTPQESPIQMEPLELSQPRPQPSAMKVDGAATDDSQAKTTRAGDVVKLPPRPALLQMLLNHKVPDSEEGVMEVLTNFAFPSKPDKKFSSIVYDSIGSASVQASTMSEVLCDCFISLWDNCLKETFYEPINIFVDTLRLILSYEHLAFTRRYVSRLVPLCMSAIDIVAIPLARASLAQNQPQPKQAGPEAPTTTGAPPISVFDTLTFLHTVGLSCVGYPNDMKTFWSHMKFDFVLLMLMRVQPLPQISLTLSLLRLSVLPDTFGAILSPEDGGVDRQSRRESDTVDRLTLLLAEKFPMPDGSDALSHHMAVLELRLQVLSVFEAMLLTLYSSLLLATHKYMLGRLIRFLDSTITALYTYHHSTHALKTQVVNTAMRIVYTLLSAPDTREVIDMRAKLSVVPQGSSKWLIALTRLAFADPVVFEEGISVESMDAAHGLLDEWLSPVEGEGLLMMFGSERSEG